MYRDCPMCGNEIFVNPVLREFRCRYCRTLLASDFVKIKGKNRVKIEIKADKQVNNVHSKINLKTCRNKL